MNVIRKTLFSTAAFTAGYFLFADVWEHNSLHLNLKKDHEQDISKLVALQKTKIYQTFENDADYSKFKKSTLVPRSHHPNHAPLGLLFGPQNLSTDSTIFQNSAKDELYIFTNLGHGLKNFNNEVHNGIIATLLDESLCFCGFNKLPSKRGVTGKLLIKFEDKIELDSNILITCKISESKGRKCVIKGEVHKILPNGKLSRTCTTAECTLVEPKWFKYLNWVPAF